MKRRIDEPIRMDETADQMLADALSAIAKDIINQHISDRRTVKAKLSRPGLELTCQISWKRLPVHILDSLELNVAN